LISADPKDAFKFKGRKGSLPIEGNEDASKRISNRRAQDFENDLFAEIKNVENRKQIRPFDERYYEPYSRDGAQDPSEKMSTDGAILTKIKSPFKLLKPRPKKKNQNPWRYNSLQPKSLSYRYNDLKGMTECIYHDRDRSPRGPLYIPQAYPSSNVQIKTIFGKVDIGNE
jgi:hypothetical protein